MTEQDKSLHVLTEMARSLALASDLLSVDNPTDAEIDEAFIEVLLCFINMRYALSTKLNREILFPRAALSMRFGRVVDRLMVRVDELFPPAS